MKDIKQRRRNEQRKAFNEINPHLKKQLREAKKFKNRG